MAAKLAELAHESPATTGSAEHVHVASPSRRRMQWIARKAHKHFGLTVHEFPSRYSGGDCLDCVHVAGSWHYHLKANPWVALICALIPDRCHCRNLALDAFGPLEKERAFFEWVLHTYGHPSGWFVGWHGERLAAMTPSGVKAAGKISDRTDAGAKIENARQAA